MATWQIFSSHAVLLLQVVHVDYVRGGIGHDMVRYDVADRVATLAADTLCVTVVASPPCSTWSAARFEPGSPQVLRTREHPMGVPPKRWRFARDSDASQRDHRE
eukprot:1625557-Pleurochrysis_carterae.AAC.2